MAKKAKSDSSEEGAQDEFAVVEEPIIDMGPVEEVGEQIIGPYELGNLEEQIDAGSVGAEVDVNAYEEISEDDEEGAGKKVLVGQSSELEDLTGGVKEADEFMDKKDYDPDENWFYDEGS